MHIKATCEIIESYHDYDFHKLDISINTLNSEGEGSAWMHKNQCNKLVINYVTFKSQ